VNRFGLALLTLFLLILPILLYSPAPAQVDWQVFPSLSFEEHRRPAVPFEHDAHNRAAGIEDCSICHHVYENGRLVPGIDSAGTPCGDCHPVQREAGRTTLLVAYHTQCRECHLQERRGPVTCAGCHPRR
jgi:hypothetical protein